MKKKLLVGLVTGLFLAGMVGVASADVIASFEMGGGNPFYDDYDIFIGVGDITSPDWIVQLAWDHAGGGSTDPEGHFGSVDISSQFLTTGGQTWWVHADDNWGLNSSYIQSFTIDTGSIVYSSPDTPVYVPDYQDRYAYINVPTQNPVPEPATMLLFGAGLAGLVGLRRRQGRK